MNGKCCVITEKGTQCTRDGVVSHGTHRHCQQHSKSKKTLHCVGNQEPWLLKGLPLPDPRLDEKALQRLRSRIEKPASKKDAAESGFIYIYALRHEMKKRLPYVKIGRTNRKADTRISEWAREHPQHKIVLLRSFEVKGSVAVIESIIFRYLHYCRIYRTPHGDQGHFHSVLASDPKCVIEDGQETTARLVAIKKQIEWFVVPVDEAARIIEGIVKVYGK